MTDLTALLSTAFSCSPGILNDATTPAEVETWDSLKHITVVTMLEEEYKVHFTTEEIISIRRIRDIRDLLAQKGVDIPTEA